MAIIKREENIIEVLLKYTSPPNYQKRKSQYYHYHEMLFDIHKVKEVELDKFFIARMDEVRLARASNYSKKCLVITDSDDYDFFRKGVLRREVSGDIVYEKQRDHSAHTLYNYILGWYLYEKNGFVKSAFDNNFSIRKLKKGYPAFANYWPFASILHDIGYLFEGSVHPFSNSSQIKQIKMGAEVFNEYFKTYFWAACGIYSTNTRNKILEITNMNLPNIENYSLSDVGSNLRNIPNKIDFCIKPLTFSSDIFDLWISHFNYYGNVKMAKRMKALNRYYDSLIHFGLGSSGLRVLDHAITSGLILLQVNTFYYQLNYRIKKIYSKLSKLDKHICDDFLFRPDNPIDPVLKTDITAVLTDPNAWWQAFVWVTSSCAIHNFIQSSNEWSQEYKNENGLLEIEEDPYAYLGILVDILQEWDRFNVDPTRMMSNILPLQGSDIIATFKNKIFHLKYPDSYKEDIEKKLNRALSGWDKIIYLD